MSSTCTSLNGLLARLTAGYGESQPIWADLNSATTGTPFTSSISILRIGDVLTVPNPLPTGVTSYIPICWSYASSLGALNYFLAKVVNLGSLTLGDGAGGASSFADGSAMPTVTELGASNATYGAVIAEVTTVLNAAPGTFTVAYTDQDGNDSVTAAITPSNSTAIRSCGYIKLATGDIGVKDIVSSNGSGSTARSGGTNPSGVIKFWGIIPLASILPNSANALAYYNFLTENFAIYRLGAGDQVSVFCVNSATTTRASAGNIWYIGED